MLSMWCKLQKWTIPKVTWEYLPELYRVGPIGVPQPFRTEHGEWGPPMARESKIDWELYSVVLICCDVMLSVLFFLLARTLSTVRLRWLSPTFRVSLGYIFGSIRLSIVIYFFRAEPQAAYTYLHAFSFMLHITIGLTALLFRDGPWKYLRPNDFGTVADNNNMNPVVWFTKSVHGVRSRIEFSSLGLMHRLASLRGIVKIRNPATKLVDSGIEKISGLHQSMKHAFRSITPQTSDGTTATKEDGLAGNSHVTLTSADTSTSGDNETENTPKKPSTVFDMAKVMSASRNDTLLSNSDQFAALHNIQRNNTQMENIGLISSPVVDVPGSQFGMNNQHLFVDESSMFPQEQQPTPSAIPSGASDFVTLVGPGQFSVRVSKLKWNESVLFWSKPSLESYFTKPSKVPEASAVSMRSARQFVVSPPLHGQNVPSSMFVQDGFSLGGSPPPSAMFSKRAPRSSSAGGQGKLKLNRSGLDEFVTSTDANDSDSDMDEVSELAPPLAGTVKIRGDGVLLAINASPPVLREVVSTARQNLALATEAHEYVVELQGRRVYCTNGKRVFYNYAEYSRIFPQRLPPFVRSTTLWLLNKLNGSISVMDLRTYRVPSTFD